MKLLQRNYFEGKLVKTHTSVNLHKFLNILKRVNHKKLGSIYVPAWQYLL
jgi:hypothetical protein